MVAIAFFCDNCGKKGFIVYPVKDKLYCKNCQKKRLGGRNTMLNKFDKKKRRVLARKILSFMSIFLMPFEMLAKILIITTTVFFYVSVGGRIHWIISILLFFGFVFNSWIRWILEEHKEKK